METIGRNNKKMMGHEKEREAMGEQRKKEKRITEWQMPGVVGIVTLSHQTPSH